MNEHDKRELVKKFLDDLGIDQRTAVRVTIDADLTVTAEHLHVRPIDYDTVETETHRLVRRVTDHLGITKDPRLHFAAGRQRADALKAERQAGGTE